MNREHLAGGDEGTHPGIHGNPPVDLSYQETLAAPRWGLLQ